MRHSCYFRLLRVGKTSLINCIAGLETPDTGRIVCHGETCFDSKQGINLPPEQRRLGYVFQDARLFPHLSVRDNLGFGLRFHAAQQPLAAPNVDDVADLLGHRVAFAPPPRPPFWWRNNALPLAAPLLCRPRLMLMDEPLSSLDMNLKRRLLTYIARIPASGTCLCSTSPIRQKKPSSLATACCSYGMASLRRRARLAPHCTRPAKWACYPTPPSACQEPRMKTVALLDRLCLSLALAALNLFFAQAVCAAGPSITTGLGYKPMVQQLCAAYAAQTGTQPTEMYSGNIGQIIEQAKAGSGVSIIVSEKPVAGIWPCLCRIPPAGRSRAGARVAQRAAPCLAARATAGICQNRLPRCQGGHLWSGGCGLSEGQQPL